MSVTPQMIDAMIAAGLTREQMATLMKASLAEAEAVAAEKRAKATAKKRRQRGHVSPSVPRTAGDTKGHSGTTRDAPAAPLDGPPLPPAPPSPPLNPPTTPVPQIPAGSVPHSLISRLHDWPTDFESLFWDAYPRHTDRKKTMAALAKVHRQDKTPFSDILDGCRRLKASNAEKAFLPHATTWLNGERWNDELPEAPIRHGPAPRPAKETAVTRFADRLEARRERHQHQDQSAPDRDPGPFIDHEADGGHDREVYEPVGGQARRFSPEASLRVAVSRWR